MRWVKGTLEIASRRTIRSRRDLWVYVARMTTYIAFLAATASGIQSWDHGWATMALVIAGTFVVTAILAVPITWEFGRMYLDLWEATQTLHTLARTDQQTGLLNNRTFVTQVEERLGADRTVALLLADLDRFKSINDRHGHPKGDEVIAAVGCVVRDLFGETAIVGRMGGEEFAVVLDCPFEDEATSRGHCTAWSDELRRRIAAIRIDGTGRAIVPTASIGIARSHPADGFSEIYARADKALYVAKASGRNRCVDEAELDFVPATDRTRNRDAGRGARVDAAANH